MKRGPATLAPRANLGFLGRWPFRCEAPRFWGLDFLGFPWILSSESRLINGLRGNNGGNFFLGPSPLGGGSVVVSIPISCGGRKARLDRLSFERWTAKAWSQRFNRRYLLAGKMPKIASSL
jgi:hypothetical protein